MINKKVSVFAFVGWIALMGISTVCPKGLSGPIGVADAIADDLKIATVNMQKALESVEAGKKAKAQLEKDITAVKKEIQSEEAAIKKMDEELKKQSLVMSEDAKAKKQKELQERFVKYQELAGRSQMELQRKQQELTQPIITKLKVVVTEVAKQKGYSLVLEKGDHNEATVLYSLDKDDLTNDVISAYNKQPNKS